jgi:hypothetical protein
VPGQNGSQHELRFAIPHRKVWEFLVQASCVDGISAEEKGLLTPLRVLAVHMHPVKLLWLARLVLCKKAKSKKELGARATDAKYNLWALGAPLGELSVQPGKACAAFEGEAVQAEGLAQLHSTCTDIVEDAHR